MMNEIDETSFLKHQGSFVYKVLHQSLLRKALAQRPLKNLTEEQQESIYDDQDTKEICITHEKTTYGGFTSNDAPAKSKGTKIPYGPPFPMVMDVARILDKEKIRK